MRTSRRLSTLVVSAALTLAVPPAVLAEPATEPNTTTTSEAARAPAPAPEPATDADRYATREAEDKSAAEFEGGDVIILSSVAVVVLIVLLVVILL